MTKEALIMLIKSCKQQDSQSQKALYQHFYNYAMTICARYASNREEAKEIMNDGFVKIFKKLDQYTFSLSFKAWLSRIMVNTAIDHYRKFQSKPRTVDLIHAQHVQSEINILAHLSAREILDLVQKLSPAYRIVFNLYVVEGYKHDEIAAELGISSGTSKSNLAKARLKLRAMIHSLDEKKAKYG